LGAARDGEEDLGEQSPGTSRGALCGSEVAGHGRWLGEHVREKRRLERKIEIERVWKRAARLGRKKMRERIFLPGADAR
jgi:hypothetical protein